MSRCQNDSLMEALRFLLNSSLLDLSRDSVRNKGGLTIYTLFNSLESVDCVSPRIKCNSLVSLDADISVPCGSNATFDTTNRETIVPVNAIQAVRFKICRDRMRCFAEEIRRRFNKCPREISDDLNVDLLNALINFRCNAFNTVYEFGVNSCALANRTIRGTIVGFNSDLIWVRSSENCKVFFLIPLDAIAFVTRK